MRDKNITIRVTEKELDAIKAKAEKLNLTMTELLIKGAQQYRGKKK